MSLYYTVLCSGNGVGHINKVKREFKAKKLWLQDNVYV